jgi:hypothetical protein
VRDDDVTQVNSPFRTGKPVAPASIADCATPPEFQKSEFERRAGTSLPLVNWFTSNNWKVWYNGSIPYKKVLIDDEDNPIGAEIMIGNE